MQVQGLVHAANARCGVAVAIIKAVAQLAARKRARGLLGRAVDRHSRAHGNDGEEASFVDTRGPDDGAGLESDGECAVVEG